MFMHIDVLFLMHVQSINNESMEISFNNKVSEFNVFLLLNWKKKM